MQAAVKSLNQTNGSTPKCETGVRPIRYASRKRARKAGQWVIRKYSGVFKKLAA
jgi:hypothetical protein